jgi:hypothetical protein
MAKASGFVALLPKSRMAAFLGCIQEEQQFAEPVAEFQHSRNTALVCFIIDGRKITHIAMGSRGSRAGTNLRRLNLEKTETLPVPLAPHRIFRLLPKRNLPSIRKRFEAGGLLTEKGFAVVIEAIRKLEPKASSLLERFSQERAERIQKLSAKTRNGLAQQKEALLTALSIANLSKESVQEWEPPDQPPVSFLDGLPNTRLREDPMVIHDLMHLPGFDIIKTYP